MNKQDVPEFVKAYIKKCKEGPYPYLAAALHKPWAVNFEVADWLQIFDDLDGIDEEQARTNQELFVRIWLEEEQVEVPQFVAKTMKMYDSVLELLAEYYFDQTAEIDNDNLAAWVDRNEKNFFKAWINGYKVEPAEVAE